MGGNEQARTPQSRGSWSIEFVRRVLFGTEAVTFANLRDRGEFLVQTEA
jgi:hypothetical protein